MPDIRHLTIYPPTLYNVSYSWNYGITSHMIILFIMTFRMEWQFLIPNTLDDHTYIHLVQWETCLYDLQDLKPEELAKWMRLKKKQVKRRKMRRIREKAEKLVWLKRELGLIHKWSWTESGTMGIVWWNRDHWDTGMGLKRLENGQKIKKEEPSTPLLHIKVESPPTPCLHYPPSSMSSSHFFSIDLNDFVWSNSPSPWKYTTTSFQFYLWASGIS